MITAIQRFGLDPNLGEEAAQKLTQALAKVKEDIVQGLSANLEDALFGGALAMKKGVDPESLAKALNNPNLYTDAYKQEDFLLDLNGIITANPSIKGIDKQIPDMVSGQGSIGKMFEVRLAASRTNEELLELGTESIVLTKGFGNDLLSKVGSTTYLIQAKKSLSGLYDALISDLPETTLDAIRGKVLTLKRLAEAQGVELRIAVAASEFTTNTV